MKSHLLILATITSFLAGNAYGDLVTHYTFDGGAADSSGHGNDGTVHGAMLTSDRFGILDKAYAFDGIDDFISASADSLPSADRTVAFWFQANDVANHPVMLGYGGNNTCGTSFFVGLNAVPPIYNDSYYTSAHCDQNNLISSYAAAPVGAWIHFALTTELSGTKMYLNGSLVASNATYINNTFVSGKDLSVGVATSLGGGAPYTDSNIGYFAGSLDDIRIYDTALSAQDIGQIFRGSEVPEPSVFALMLVGLAALSRLNRGRK